MLLTYNANKIMHNIELEVRRVISVASQQANS